MKGDWSVGISDLLWTQAVQKGRACRPSQASGLLKERKLDRTLQGICWDSSTETTSNSTSGLMYLDGMLLRFLDARVWTFSTGKEFNISVLCTFVSIAVKLSQVQHYPQIIVLMR
ncbi:Ephrin type-A receptor 7 [Gossypium arboreum]|uniref:Ephrin type-A receptor 7 n=1 Tax=Gossypium arboreum TaxID=29729 RepID=A0A0B0P6M6_GOSAR|nr:Ephrin type-A receptor 7 [Gossypium arboreum]